VYFADIFLIDYGLTKRYKDPTTNVHIPFSEGKSLTGTARYASIHAHKGYEQGRRDDLESIAYILIYFMRGNLPWQGLNKDKNDDNYVKVMEVKQSTSL